MVLYSNEVILLLGKNENNFSTNLSTGNTPTQRMQSVLVKKKLVAFVNVKIWMVT